MYDAVILDYRSGQDDGCKLRVVGSWYSMTSYGIALPKNSKYKDLIDKTIIQFSETGVLERTQNFWFSGTCKNTNPIEESSRNSNQFDIRQSSSVFLLLTGGIGFTIMLSLVQNYCHKYLSNFKPRQIWSNKNDSHNKVLEKAEKPLLLRVICYFYNRVAFNGTTK